MKKAKYYHLDGTPFSEAQMEITKELEGLKGTKIEIQEVHSPEKVQGQLMIGGLVFSALAALFLGL